MYRKLTTVDMKFEFKTLLELPNQAVLGLFNEVDRKVYIWFSINPIESIMRLVNSINKMSSIEFRSLYEDRNKLELRVIETGSDVRLLKAKSHYWKTHYINNKYSLYNRLNKDIKYEIKYNFDFNLNTLVFAKSNYDAVMIAVFPTKAEAEIWVETAFEYNVILPIIRDDELTRKYYEMRKTGYKTGKYLICSVCQQIRTAGSCSVCTINNKRIEDNELDVLLREVEYEIE